MEATRHVSDGATAVVHMAAAYRHAMLNHLQVVLGWLQLGQPGRAADHIHQLREIALGETRLVRATRPEAAAVLLLRRGFAEARGIEVSYDAAESLRGFGWPEELPDAFVAAAIDAALVLVGRSTGGRHLQVAVSEEAGRQVLTVRLSAEGWADEGLPLFLEEVDRLLAERGEPFRAEEVLARLEAWGGCVECRRDGQHAVVRISWPRAG